MACKCLLRDDSCDKLAYAVMCLGLSVKSSYTALCFVELCMIRTCNGVLSFELTMQGSGVVSCGFILS